MIQLWYVVWVLFSASGEAITQPHYMSGPYPSETECLEAGKLVDWPPDSAVAPSAPRGVPVYVSIGCIQIHVDGDDTPGDRT